MPGAPFGLSCLSLPQGQRGPSPSDPWSGAQRSDMDSDVDSPLALYTEMDGTYRASLSLQHVIEDGKVPRGNDWGGGGIAASPERTEAASTSAIANDGWTVNVYGRDGRWDWNDFWNQEDETKQELPTQSDRAPTQHGDTQLLVEMRQKRRQETLKCKKPPNKSLPSTLPPPSGISPSPRTLKLSSMGSWPT